MTLYKSIFDALQQSVVETVASNPENLEEELAKRFGDAETALGERLGADLPLQLDEADHVTVLRERLDAVADVLGAIDRGGVLAKADGEAPEGDAMLLAKRWLRLGDLMLAGFANEQSAFLADGERPVEGETLLKLDMGGDGEDLLIKSVLPPDAAAHAMHPDHLDSEVVALAVDLFGDMGVSPEDLLAKAAPDDEEDEDAEGAEREEGEGEEREEGDDEDEQAHASDGEEGGEELQDAEEGGLPQDPMDAIIHLGGLGLIQIEEVQKQFGGEPLGGGGAGDEMEAVNLIGQHFAMAVHQAQILQKALGGGMEEGAGEEQQPGDPEAEQVAAPAGGGESKPEGESGEAGTAAPPAAEDEDGKKPPFAKAAPGGDLSKVDAANPELEELRKVAAEARAEAERTRGEAEELRKAADSRASELEARIARMEAQPSDKGPAVKVVGLTKAADMGQAEDTGPTLEDRAQKLAELQKRDPSGNAAAAELMKIIHAGGGRPYDPRTGA